MRSPGTQRLKLKGPVPTGWVLLVAAVLGATITASPQAMSYRKVEVGWRSVTTASAGLGQATLAIGAKSCF
jgi:hypothetical protein